MTIKMDQNDKIELEKILTQINGVSRQQRNISREVVNSWFNMLNCFELLEVVEAFSRFTSTDGWMPAPADIRRIITDGYGWPPPGMAWDMCPKTESCGAWVCNEMLIARESCIGEIDRGHFGAKKDFEEIYNRLVNNAKYDGLKPVFRYSGANSGSIEERARIKQNATEVAYERGFISLNIKTLALESVVIDRAISFDMHLIDGKSVNIIEEKNRIDLTPEQKTKSKSLREQAMIDMRKMLGVVKKNTQKITEED